MASSNTRLNNKKFSKYFLLLVLFISVVAVGFLIPLVDAAHPPGKDFVTRTLPSATNEISFRDISNTAETSSTISVDTSTAASGFITITVTDADADYDTEGLDVVLSSAISTTSGLAEAEVELEETGINTGIFSGEVILSSSTSPASLDVSAGDEITVLYDSEPPAVGRLFAQIGSLSGTDDVILKDSNFRNTPSIDEFSATCPFDLYVHTVDVSFAGVTPDPDTMTVTISYANTFLGDNTIVDGVDFEDLEVLYRPTEGASFISLTNDLTGHNSIAKTITSQLPPQVQILIPPSTIIDSNGNGQYALGINLGTCTGGGGGGLVRPGLVVNALGGIGGLASGGGGAGPPGPTITLGALSLYDSAVEIISMPQEIRDIALDHDPHTPLEPIFDPYEDFDLPLSINGKGFVLGDYENTIETQTIEPGEPTEFVLVYYTNSELAHSSLNFNLGPTRTIAGSDTQVLLYNDKPPEIVDPNGNIASFTGSINNEGDLKRVATFLVTFSESVELPNPDIVIRSWTDRLSSGDIIVYDAIEIAQPEIVEIADEDLPEPEIQTLKSQYVPIWIKNNAAWWSQELIEDSDFVAGIEYLIQNEIITIQDNQVIASSYSSNEIPEWIKNNAGWWSENLITEKEFIDGLQWLISNGIIQVIET